MSTLDNILSSPPVVRLLLTKLHRQGRLAPLIREALADQVVQEEARQAGLAVSTEELQKAADSFRRRHGLLSAADTQAWLNERGLSVDDFEAGLEEDLLAAKLRRQVSAAGLEVYFATHQADYERLRLGLLLVGRDDLAGELASQVRDEGRGLEDVAGEHGLAVARRRLARKDLAGPLAEALAPAQPGELVGPVATPAGFALLVLEERRPGRTGPGDPAAHPGRAVRGLAGRAAGPGHPRQLDPRCGRMTGTPRGRCPLSRPLRGGPTPGPPRRSGRAWGCSGKPRRRCPQRRASGQGVWEGARKTPTRGEKAEPFRGRRSLDWVEGK
jgi:hypothetical protein